MTVYFNPRPPRGGRPICEPSVLNCCTISIHALPAEGDEWLAKIKRFVKDISIHALPAEGDDPCDRVRQERRRISIHALPAEGDPTARARRHPTTDFNPRPPRGGRPSPSFIRSGRRHFNPRPPRGGRRLTGPRLLQIIAKVQSTPSPRRATFNGPAPSQDNREISIHALPAEGDVGDDLLRGGVEISIHALPAEGDYAFFRFPPSPSIFQSTPSPRRATLKTPAALYAVVTFQSTPSPRRATSGSRAGLLWRRNFNPRPPRGGRPRWAWGTRPP